MRESIAGGLMSRLDVSCTTRTSAAPSRLTPTRTFCLDGALALLTTELAAVQNSLYKVTRVNRVIAVILPLNRTVRRAVLSPH